MFGALFNLGTSVISGGMNVVTHVANAVADTIDETTAVRKKEPQKPKQLTSLEPTALEYAKHGDTPSLKKYIQTYPHHMNLKCQGYTLLHMAAIHGQGAVVDLLLTNSDLKKDVTDEKEGKTALQLAAHHDQADVAVKLIRAGSNYLPTGSCTTLACDMGSDLTRETVTSALLLHLLEKRSLINGFKVLGSTILHYSARGGRADIVEQLLSLGAAINQPNDDGYTALHEGALSGNVDVVSTLLDSQCNVDAQTQKDGYTALMLGVLQMDIHIVVALLRGGCSINARTHKGQTAVHLAVELMLKDVVDERGKYQPEQSNTDMVCPYPGRHRMQWNRGQPAHYTSADLNSNAEEEAHMGVQCRMCMTRISTVNEDLPYAHCSECKYDVCLKCYKSMKQAVTVALIDAHADLNVIDANGCVPLSMAASANNSLVSILLITAGCNINIRNKANKTPFMIASDAGSDDVAVLLLERGCDYDEDSVLGAAVPQKIRILEGLIEHGAMLTCTDDRNNTALHIACNREYEDVASTLIKSESAQLINAVNEELDTALHICCRRNNITIASLLVKHNALYNLRNKKGETALELGSEKTSQVVAETILESRRLSTMPIVIRDVSGLHAAEINGLFTPAHRLVHDRPVYSRVVRAADVHHPNPKKGITEVTIRMEYSGSEWIILREVVKKKGKSEIVVARMRAPASEWKPAATNKNSKSNSSQVVPVDSSLTTSNSNINRPVGSGAIVPIRESALLAYDLSLRPDTVVMSKPVKGKLPKNPNGVWFVLSPSCIGVCTTYSPQLNVITASGAAARVSLPIHRELAAVDRKGDILEAISAHLPQHASTIRDFDFEGKTAVDLVLDEKSNFPDAVKTQVVLHSLPFDEAGAHILNHGNAWLRLFTPDDKHVNVISKILRVRSHQVKELSAVSSKDGKQTVLSLGGPKCTDTLQFALCPLYLRLHENAPLSKIKECLQESPESARMNIVRNGKKLTVYQYAISVNRSTEILAEILSYTLPIDRVTEMMVPASEHGFAWTWTLTSVDEKHVEVVEGVLNICGGLALRLADARDQHGRKAVDIATPKCQELIRSRLFFYERYDIRAYGAKEHQSATCIVALAVDRKDENQDVALKFMKRRDQFERERAFHVNNSLDNEYVMDITRTHDGDKDRKFKSECTNKGYSGYNYCLVMPAADRTLQRVMAHERISGREWDIIKITCSQILKALDHLHSNGLVHGDIKPLNIVRVNGKYKLIDLDASVSYSKGHYAGLKFSSAYVAPELLFFDEKLGNYGVRRFDVDENDEECVHPAGQELLPYSLVPAHPSMDMWSFGVTMFQLCSSEPLFISSDEDNIDQENMKLLHEWTPEFKDTKLAKVKDNYARNLISQLLTRDPSDRPTAARALAHPFLSNKTTARMPGEEAQYDVFLSYRVRSDADRVALLYSMLLDRGLKVWWDRVCLEPGVPWEEGFCDGLVQSKAFVPILSLDAIHHPEIAWQNFANLRPDSKVDNVFLEHRLALELRNLKLIEKIYPVMVGEVIEKDETTGEVVYGRYRCPAESPPANAAVDSVESKIREHMSRQAIGAPMHDSMTVRDVYQTIMTNQGGFVSGKEQEAFESIADAIAKMISVSKAPNKNANQSSDNANVTKVD